MRMEPSITIPSTSQPTSSTSEPTPSTSQSTPSYSRVPAELQSALKGLFFAHFHAEAGREILFRVPEDLGGLEDWEHWSAYVLPKRELMGCPITFVMKEADLAIGGQPMELQNKHYSRNTFLFNLCLVTTASAAVQELYQPIAQKLAAYMAALEIESDFLSGPERRRLPAIIAEVFRSLRSEGRADIAVSEQTRICLKLVPPSPAPALDSSVSAIPVFTRAPPEGLELLDMDVLSQKIAGLMDGRRSVGEISLAVEVEADLVARTALHLEHYGLCRLLPPFAYSSVYVASSRLQELWESPKLQQDAAAFVGLGGRAAKWSTALALYASLRRGLPLAEWCMREEPRAKGVDEHRLIQFGLLRGLVEECRPYPIYTGREEEMELWHLDLDGRKSLHEIAQIKGIPVPALTDLIGTNSDRIAIIWK